MASKEHETVAEDEQQAQSDRVIQEQSHSEDLSLVSVFGGLRLHPTTWKPTETAKALVYVCHGVGEHMGRYEKLGSHLSQNGLLVFGHDHVGHGRSEGDRVHIEDVDTYVQDVIHHVELMKNEHPHLPCILIGHSMGGLIAGHVSIQKSGLFSALLLSASAAEYEAKFSIWVINKALNLLGRVAPQLGIRTLDPSLISSIPEEVERYVNDPLVWHGALKARWASAMIASINLFRENIGHISLPLLIIHGSDDNLVPITGSHFIHDNVSSQDKRFEIFEGSCHEILHDKEEERALNLIKDWVLACLTSAPEHTSQAESQPTKESPPTDAEQAAESQPTEDLPPTDAEQAAESQPTEESPLTDGEQLDGQETSVHQEEGAEPGSIPLPVTEDANTDT